MTEQNHNATTPLPMTPLGGRVLCVAVSTKDAPTLNTDFIDRLALTVQMIRADESVRAVILKGGPAYFSAGASRVALAETERHENILVRALEIPRLLLDIPTPTIAAMSGHAIGGGFLLGMWCDIPLLAEESRYGINAVKLGIPPIMGATEILADVIGPVLAQRLLYTGRLVKGRTFKAPGCGLAGSVLPKTEVWPHAVALAQETAEAPRDVLVLAKSQFSLRRQAMLARVADTETAMMQPFMNQPITRKSIAERYPVPLHT